MDWKLFGLLCGIGIVLYILYLFYSQREFAYLSILLYRQGDGDAYLKELDTVRAKLFFSRKIRLLMSIDAYMLKEDQAALEKIFAQVMHTKLRNGDRFLVLQKEMVFQIDQGELRRAEEIDRQMHELYQKMTEKQQKMHREALKEEEYLYAIHIRKDGKYAAELLEKAHALKETLPAGVCFYRSAQSYLLQDNKKAARKALEEAVKKLRDTPVHARIAAILKEPDLQGLCKQRI